MREPEVSEALPALCWAALAVLALLPVLFGVWTALSTAAFLVEFLSEGTLPLLSRLTPPPAVRPLASLPDARSLAADLYEPFAPWASRSTVLVHGLAAAGKDDPRLQRAARLLARAGLRTLVPTVPGLTRLRLRLDDAEVVVQAIKASSRWGSVKVLGISVGVGPALLAAGDPRVAGQVDVLLSLGGYASTVELLRYFLTGTYGYGVVGGQVTRDQEAVSAFVRANTDLLNDAALRLVDNRDPARVESLVRALSPRLRELLDALSPERAVGRLAGRLLLVHGTSDPAVPFTESLRLADAAAHAGVPTRLVLLQVVGHVEPTTTWRRGWAAAGELLALWTLAYVFFNP